MSFYNEVVKDLATERRDRSKLIRNIYIILGILIILVIVTSVYAIKAEMVHHLSRAIVFGLVSISATVIALSINIIKIYFTLEQEHVLMERLSVVRQTKSGDISPLIEKLNG